MHPDFNGIGNVLARNVYQRSIPNYRKASGKAVTCKVYATTNGVTQCVTVTTEPDATRQAWAFVAKGATTVWVESNGMKRCVKGILVY
jgi:hypothetical protein